MVAAARTSAAGNGAIRRDHAADADGRGDFHRNTTHRALCRASTPGCAAASWENGGSCATRCCDRGCLFKTWLYVRRDRTARRPALLDRIPNRAATGALIQDLTPAGGFLLGFSVTAACAAVLHSGERTCRTS